MSRTKRFLTGVSFGYLNQALIILTGLWLTPFLLRRLGQQDYGLWLICTQILFYVSLLDFGVIALLPRETAFATGQENTQPKEKQQVLLIIGQAARITLWQTPIVALVAIIIWFLLPQDWMRLHQPIGIILATFVLLFPFRIYPAILQGLQDFGFLGKLSLLSFSAGTSSTIIFAVKGFGLLSIAAGWIMQQCLTASISWWRLHKVFPEVMSQQAPPITWHLLRETFSKSIWVSVSQLAIVLLNSIDILIVGKLLGPEVVVTYSCTGKLIYFLASQPVAFVNSALPALSQMRASEPRERLLNVSIALSQATLLFSGLAFSIALTINQGFVTHWVGDRLYGGQQLTLLIILLTLMRHWNLTIGCCIFCFGHERRMAVLGILEGAVAFVSIYVLVLLVGVNGAPLGMALGVCLVNLPNILVILAREMEVSVKYILKRVWLLFWRLGALLFGIAFLQSFNPLTSITQMTLTSLAVLLIYAVIMWPVVNRQPLRDYLIPKLNSLSRLLAQVPFPMKNI